MGTKAKSEWTKGFEAGVLAAAQYLDEVGQDTYRNEVLQLQCLTLADLERFKSS